MNEDRDLLENTEGNQPTRVLASASNNPQPVQEHTRRRRSDIHHQAEVKPETQINETQPAFDDKKNTVPTYLQRKPVQTTVPQAMHEVPKEGVPVPAALRKNNEAAGRARQPVQAPGYSARKPLGYAMPEDTYPRRPEAGPEEQKRSHKALTITLIAVLVLGLITLVLLLVPSGSGNLLSSIKDTVVSQISGEKKPEKAALIKFEATPMTGSAPLDVAFSLTTNLSVQEVRLTDNKGNEIDCTPTSTDNSNTRVWILTATYKDAFTGDVHAAIFDGVSWQETEQTILLKIAANPLETPVPTAEPTAVPTEVPSETMEAIQAESTPEATEAPTVEALPTPTGLPLVPLTVDQGEPTATDVYVEEDVDLDDPDATVSDDDDPPFEDVPNESVEKPAEEPTEEPTAEPTAEPVVTQAPTETVQLPKLEIPTAKSAALIHNVTVYNGKKALNAYNREPDDRLNMPAVGEYTPKPYGLLTFRGDSFRQNAAHGNVEQISEMEVLWKYAVTGSLKSSNGKTTYTGIGQNSQPVILQWSTEVRGISNLYDTAKETKALKEVIVAGEDGNIYFLNLADGTETRDKIKVGYPLRTTPSIHPYGFPLLTVGQYAKKISGAKNASIGLRFYDLMSGKQLSMIDGMDGTMKRYSYAVGSFNTSPLINAASDTLIAVGSNGLLYATKLKTDFNYNEQKITVEPSSIVMKAASKKEKDKQLAVESSPVSYQDYVWYADMGGYLRCVNVNTMEVLWAAETGDAVVASLSLDMDDAGNLWLYTANTLTNRSKGDCQIRRYNAVTGEESWTYALNMNKKIKKYTPGVSASPVVGNHELDDLVYFTVSGLSASASESLGFEKENTDAVLLALNKETGKVAWAKKLDSYSYSSPVAVYDEQGKGWILQASHSGRLTLYDGATGKELHSLTLDGNINASPAVFKSTLVIGTQGGKNNSYIYAISLK